MRILEFEEDDYRGLELTEKDNVRYNIDNIQLSSLMLLDYELVTDGELVYAMKGTDDIIEVGKLQQS